MAFLVFGANNLSAQSINLISDEETEQLIGNIAKPLFKAAGVNYNRNNIFIVNDGSLNAFVADGNNLFVHTGTIMSASGPNEIAGVIAHETGHIQGGHILRQKLKAKAMQEMTLASVLLAGAAAAVGSGDTAMAVLLGSQSSSLTHYTKYRTEEERSADEAAMNLLVKTEQSPEGMLKFMKRISQQNALNGMDESPYFRTHPVTRERLTFFEENVKNSNIENDDKLQNDFDLVKAKLFAYLNNPQKTLQKYPLSNQSQPALYAQAIAYFKQLNIKQAIAKTDKLIEQSPNNPFYKELKAQIYLETGKVKLAKQEYQQALNLLPNSSLLQISLAQAILEDEPNPEEIKQVINLLNKSLIARPAGFSWLLLARAYGLNGDEAAANYASAEYSLRIGADKVAKRQAMEAKKLKPSAKIALKLDDLIARTDAKEADN